MWLLKNHGIRAELTRIRIQIRQIHQDPDLLKQIERDSVRVFIKDFTVLDTWSPLPPIYGPDLEGPCSLWPWKGVYCKPGHSTYIGSYWSEDSEIAPPLLHGTFIRWYLRTQVWRKISLLYFFFFKFLYAFDLNKCLYRSNTWFHCTSARLRLI